MAGKHQWMAANREWSRKSFDEFMELLPLQERKAPLWSKTDSSDSRKDGITRYMSTQPAWTPGNELPWEELTKTRKDVRPHHAGPGAFGGCVYAMASLAAARAVEEEERLNGGDISNRPGIQSIQGVFTLPSLIDRPFIFEVSTIQTGRSSSTRLVKARQPKHPSSRPSGPFPESDRDLPLNGICFSCITTFKRPTRTHDDIQAPVSAQTRYASILSQRAPEEWAIAPQNDIEMIKNLFPGAGHGAFPILDMHKVDMTEYNTGKEIPDRRELILYRPMRPIAAHDVNGHIVSHAFEADRNGLVMLGNHLGYGKSLLRAASISYAFYVHTNPVETVMDGQGWWLQEVCWPRVNAGRCTMEVKIWSPEGKHVASGYQDGMLSPAKDARTGKL